LETEHQSRKFTVESASDNVIPVSL